MAAHALSPLPIACPSLDALLDGGLEPDAITLVFGEGGSGKTNLALQASRTAACNGTKVAFIDTEGVSATRLEQVFSSCPERIDQMLFYTPFDIEEQEQMVQRATLPKNLGLIVVDSINMHYRLHIDGGDDAEKAASRSLYKQLHILTTFARKHGVPVLVTGQVYGGEDSTLPFARRTMEHLAKAMVRFEKGEDRVRKATVLKHRSIPEGRSARFRIGPEGLEGSDPAVGFGEPQGDPAEARAHPEDDADDGGYGVPREADVGPAGGDHDAADGRGGATVQGGDAAGHDVVDGGGRAEGPVDAPGHLAEEVGDAADRGDEDGDAPARDARASFTPAVRMRSDTEE